MSDIAIRVENLSKAYRIGLKEQRHETLMGAMTSFIKSPLENFRNVRKLSRFEELDHGPQDNKSVVSGQLSVVSSEDPPSDIIWALKDVSFEVKHGEALGIIGRNGAGKSTLLKILSRITEPTTGRATVYGRVGSLLEVGTGFHPDLTGRENVYLNGTILGMKKREVDAKFDEIVEFSGVEKFIDTPVKRYSSGMRVRLAFSVAAHLEPEILIVDEVLAVGDMEFQKKCLGKMQNVAGHGRTVLFVSHNMTAITNLCGRGLFLEEGKVFYEGSSEKVVKLYLQKQVPEGKGAIPIRLPDDPVLKINAVTVRQGDSGAERFLTHEPIRILIDYTLKQHVRGFRIGFDLCSSDETVIWRSFQDDTPSQEARTRDPGDYLSECVIPRDLLSAQSYSVKLLATIHRKRWITQNDIVISLNLQNVSGVNSHYADQRPGILMPRLEWSTRQRIDKSPAVEAT